MEQNFEATVSHNLKDLVGEKASQPCILELQARTQTACQGFKLDLGTLVRDLAQSYTYWAIEIPRGLHKFVIGKGGSNLEKLKAMPEWNGRLVDISVPGEYEESDQIIIVVRNLEAGDESSVKAEDLVVTIERELMKFAENLADFTVKTVSVPARFHGRLIGSGGERLREIIGREFASSVIVRFPSAIADESLVNNGSDNVDSDNISLRGSSRGVQEVGDRIMKLISEWKHSEILNSFEERVNVPKGTGTKLISSSGWLYKAVKEALAENPSRGCQRPTDLSETDEYLSIKTSLDSESSEKHDIIRVIGAKHVLAAARDVLQSRAKKIEDTADIRIDIFSTLVPEVAKELEIAEENQRLFPDSDISVKEKVVRRLVGREGKVIKNLSAKHGVYLRIDRAGEHDESLEIVETNSGGAALIIKGPKVAVEECRQEVVKLVEDEVCATEST